MPDASERIRVEPRPTRAGAKRRRWRAFADRRVVAGAALAAMMIGIVVNAVALQHGRRIALDADAPPPPAAVRSTALAAPSPAPSPIAAPAPAPTREASAAPAKSSDAIADFLRGQGTDKRRLTLSAQSALADLGFPVKATGALDASTRNALVAFEKSRKLPASTEITAKLVRTLKDAAKAN